MKDSTNAAYMNESNLYPSLEVLTVLNDFRNQTKIDIQTNGSSSFDIDLLKLNRFFSI